jgi:hypothetical protein
VAAYVEYAHYAERLTLAVASAAGHVEKAEPVEHRQ